MASGSAGSTHVLQSKFTDLRMFSALQPRKRLLDFQLQLPDSLPHLLSIYESSWLRQTCPKLPVLQKRENGKREPAWKARKRGEDFCLQDECPGSQAPFPVENLSNGLKYWKTFFKEI